jgi:hypothetical protein
MQVSARDQIRLAYTGGLRDASGPMSNWEYKVISSGKGGFASPALMEKFLNDLGQENWEIISFHQPADNALAFHGLARRSTQRDWTLEDAAKAAARAEADKLRAEFEAKFKAGSGQAAGGAPEEEGETFLAEEKSKADGDLRRLRDTSRDDDPDSDEENGAAPKDEWDKLAAEDELPTFFDALRPHMRRNQRGPGMSVGVDYLAKKWHLDESDLKNALVECGLQIPADENAKPVYVEYEGELYWVNINRRGETWINLRDKPQPVFRIVQGKRLEGDEAAAADAVTEAAAPRQEQAPRPPREPREPREAQPTPAAEPQSSGQAPATPKSFLGKIRGMMRRNRHGHGYSGSFQFLTKALKLDDAGLLAQLGESGVKLTEDPAGKPLFHEEGDFLYWLQKNQRGEIWINARKGRAPEGGGKPESGDGRPEAEGNATDTAPGEVKPDTGVPAETAGVPVSETAPMPAGAPSVSSLPPENILTAVRLLMQPKKRGEGFTASITELAEKLEKTPDTVQGFLANVGLQLPDSPKGKPTFAEHGGEIYWLNANAKGQVWLNAKAASATKKAKGRKAEGEEGEAE